MVRPTDGRIMTPPFDQCHCQHDIIILALVRDSSGSESDCRQASKVSDSERKMRRRQGANAPRKVNTMNRLEEAMTRESPTDEMRKLIEAISEPIEENQDRLERVNQAVMRFLSGVAPYEGEFDHPSFLKSFERLYSDLKADVYSDDITEDLSGGSRFQRLSQLAHEITYLLHDFDHNDINEAFKASGSPLRAPLTGSKYRYREAPSANFSFDAEVGSQRYNNPVVLTLDFKDGHVFVTK